MKVIFLDVNGVLNLHHYEGKELIFFEGEHFCDYSILFLQKLVESRQDIKIVLSSKWRKRREYYITIERLLENYQLEIYDITTTKYFGEDIKERDINEWLSEHSEVEKFIILSEIKEMGDLKKHHISIDGNIGFSAHYFKKAKKLLRSKDSKYEKK